MDNREGKGSNMMESWRVTSETRFQEKTQLQPVLEAGKMTDKGVALSDFRCYRNTSYGCERHIFSPPGVALAFSTKSDPEDLDC